MRAITELFTLDGRGILTPDADVTVTTADVEGDSARDRSGVLHRAVLRRGVTAWEFTYDTLTDAERQYMLELLMGEAVFSFTHPGKADAGKQETSLCCCRGWSMDYHDAARGQWRKFRFRVEEV